MSMEPSAADHPGRRATVGRVGPFDRRPLRRTAVAGVVGVLVLVTGGCSDDSSTVYNTVDNTVGTVGTVEDDVVVEAGQQPDGFSTITARITETDGEVCDVCVWLADTPEERGRGLMGVTDLGAAVGMVFRFDEPIAGSFYMFQTPTPLSIAWFAPDDGEFVGTADMAPCLDAPAGECPLYSPGAEYDLALEVFEGGLVDLGVGPGSRLELIDGTEADGCPLASAD
jgi:uncharacterized membrane protein (UPF0127 family)